MNRFFNHDFYDSLIFSGKINFLEPDLQQQIQNIFHMIRQHNEYLEITQRVRLAKQKHFDDQTQLPKEVYFYYIGMNRYEKELTKSIPDMMKKLNSKFHIV